jgi:hypothetical protein
MKTPEWSPLSIPGVPYQSTPAFWEQCKVANVILAGPDEEKPEVIKGTTALTRIIKRQRAEELMLLRVVTPDWECVAALRDVLIERPEGTA